MMSKKRFAFDVGLAAAALTVGVLAPVGMTAPTSATPADATSDPTTLSLDRNSGMPAGATRGVVDDWPEHEYAGDIYIRGTYGYALFDDYDGDSDRDDFYAVDMNDDGWHISFSATHDGETFNVHDAGGKAAKIHLFDFDNGETAHLEACVWNSIHTVSVGCVTNKLTE